MSPQLFNASAQLLRRPADEHFASFAELKQSAAVSRDNGVELKLDPNSIIFRPQESAPGRVGVSLADGFPDVELTFHSAKQLAGLAGANPSFVFDRLSPKTAALALNEGIRNRPKVDGEGGDPRVLALVQSGPIDKLRAVTSTGYHRVWDADLLAEVERFLLPHGFKPALPTKNTDAQQNNIMGNNKPALFRGDLDSFWFFMVDDTSEGHGGRPVRRGMFGYNSEVGARSFGTASFVFDDLCANFIIWGARAVRRMKLVHRCKEGRSILSKFRGELIEAAPTLAKAELELLRRAGDTMFAKDREKAVERLVAQFGAGQKQAEHILSAADLRENRGLRELTHGWVANGATSLAKETSSADSMVALATMGGDIIVSAGGAS